MNAIEASLYDIFFLKKIVTKKIIKKVADVTINTFTKHLSYLNNECIIFLLLILWTNEKKKENSGHYKKRIMI